MAMTATAATSSREGALTPHGAQKQRAPYDLSLAAVYHERWEEFPARAGRAPWRRSAVGHPARRQLARPLLRHWRAWLRENNTPAESLFPGMMALQSLGEAARDEILELFPELDPETGRTIERQQLVPDVGPEAGRPPSAQRKANLQLNRTGAGRRTGRRPARGAKNVIAAPVPCGGAVLFHCFPAMHGNPKDAHRLFHYVPGKACLPYGCAICGASEWALPASRSLPHHRTIGKRHDPKAAHHRQDPGISPEPILLSSSQVILAGAVGFEPTVHGTKNRCLTTWPRPNCGGVSIQAVWRVQKGKTGIFFIALPSCSAAARVARARRRPVRKAG